VARREQDRTNAPHHAAARRPAANAPAGPAGAYGNAPHGRRVRRASLALASAAVLLLPAGAGADAVAQPRATDWPPADLQEYVDSGRYLRDVQAAAAPAAAWLVQRTDQIAADRAACRAAGIPFPDPVAPAAARAAVSRAGASAAPATGLVAPLATRPAGAATTRAAAGWAGATTLVPDRATSAVRRLRGAGVRLSTTAPATASWRRVLLPVTSGSWSGATVTAAHTRTIRLRAGRRVADLEDVRVRFRGSQVRLSARVGTTRLTVLTGTAPSRGRTNDATAGVVRVAETRMRLTAVAARRFGAALGARELHAGRFATLTLRANRAGAATPGAGGTGSGATGTAPAAGGAAGPGVTAAVATVPSCAAIPARPAIVLDIDETALSNYIGTFGDPEGGSAGYAAVSVFGAGTALQPVFDLYAAARARGVAVFFVTARPGILEASTVSNLRRVGYTVWDGLTFKNDLTSEKDVHKTGERKKIEDAGFRIVLNVGDQQTDIDGGYAERAFKLPNPFY
jgi:hypothetical protein